MSIMWVRTLIIFIALLIFSNSSFSAIDNVGLLDNVLARYSTAAAGWATSIEARATWLFWLLVPISMVWTFGYMLFRRADLGELFAEFIRFTIFTGFFWWLLTNGPSFANSIIQSMRQIGGEATGLSASLSPSGIVDIGFEIFDKVISESSFWSPASSAVGIIIALIILVILALVGVNMLLLLVAGWVLAYGGIFYLGFGGSRWTSDIAINYYKTVFGIAMQLLTMVLLVGIGKSILDQYYANMSGGISFNEMAVLLIVSVILLMLVNKIPQLISGVITGASIGGMGIGQLGAGAALGAAGMAAAGAAIGGAMMAAGAAQAAGGASAIMAAISKAQENVATGNDILSTMGAASGATGSSSGGSGGSSETGDTPLANAAGFAGGGSSSVGAASSVNQSDFSNNDTSPGGGQSSSDATSQDGSPQEAGSEGNNADTETVASAGGFTPSESTQSSGFGGMMGKAGRIAVDASANLARGVGDVAKQKATKLKDAAKDRIAQTIGGKISTSIQEHKNDSGFEYNSLGSPDTETQADPESEIAAFRDRD